MGADLIDLRVRGRWHPRTVIRRLLCCAPLALALGCIDERPAPADAAVTDVAVVTDVSTAIGTPAVVDAGTPDAKTVERGPMSIALDGDPNGLTWDAASGTLFIADDDNNRILRWQDAAGFLTPVALPAIAPDLVGLGQLLLLRDGTLLVIRFGGGTAGAVIAVRPDGTAANIPGLDVTRRSLGLAVAADDTLYVSYFLRIAGGARVGSVARLTLNGTEAEVLPMLRKPVGIAVLGDDLLVADQDQNQLLRAPRTGGTPSLFATVMSPDLLTVTPDGTVFVGSTTGNVYRVSADGSSVTVFQGGFQQTRGLAYDAVHRRLFVADHDATPADGTTHRLRILPVD